MTKKMNAEDVGRILLSPNDEILKVFLDGQIIAQTNKGYCLVGADEGAFYYFPASDVDMDKMVPSDRVRESSWGGRVAYFDYCSTGRTRQIVSWFHPEPPFEFYRLRNHLAFFAQRIDHAWVGNSEVLTGIWARSSGWVLSAPLNSPDRK